MPDKKLHQIKLQKGDIGKSESAHGRTAMLARPSVNGMMQIAFY
jgi:hypothetical protein